MPQKPPVPSTEEICQLLRDIAGPAGAGESPGAGGRKSGWKRTKSIVVEECGEQPPEQSRVMWVMLGVSVAAALIACVAAVVVVSRFP